MSVVHKVTGYDRATDKLELAFDLPLDRFEEISNLVGLPPEYKETYGSFPLAHNAARKLSSALQLHMNVDLYDWFIEPFSSDHALVL